MSEVWQARYASENPLFTQPFLCTQSGDTYFLGDAVLLRSGDFALLSGITKQEDRFLCIFRRLLPKHKLDRETRMRVEELCLSENTLWETDMTFEGSVDNIVASIAIVLHSVNLNL